MSLSAQQPPMYQPGYDQSGSSTYTFNAPLTKQQTFTQTTQTTQMRQAGGPAGISAPPPPPLPPRKSKAYGSYQPIKLRTRNWSSSPWHSTQRYQDTYAPPPSLLKGQQFGQRQVFGQGQQFGLQKQYGQSWGQKNLYQQNVGQSWGQQQDWGTTTTTTSSNIPNPPPLPSMLRQRKWSRGPYKQPRLRTKNWGNRTKRGWTNWNGQSFQRSIGGIESNQANLFKSYWTQQGQQGQQGQQTQSRDLGQDFSGQQQQQQQQLGGQQQQLGGQQQQFTGQQLGGQQLGGQQLGGQQLGGQQLGGQQLGGQQFSGQQFGGQQFIGQQQLGGQPGYGTSLGAPIGTSRAISTAPVSTYGTGLTGSQPAGAPLIGKRARRQQRQTVIAPLLQARLPPPIGDPEVNHYRRGAPAVVPLAGPAAGTTTGGGLRGRRIGRRNNRGGARRARRGANWLPVPATQPPVIAPVQTVGAPIPITSTVYSSSAGTPLSSGISQGGISTYGPSSGISQSGLSTYGLSSGISQQPLSSGISQAGLAQQPLYSSALPVQQQPLQFMTKQQDFQQQQLLSRPVVGSGAF